MRVEYLNPGVLVVGDVKVSGCISYKQTGYNEQNGGQTLEADWQTHKRVENVEEQRRLMATRSNMLGRIKRLGVPIHGMGILVPIENTDSLMRILARIREEIAEYNASATCTYLSGNFACFTIASTDEAIARALYDRAISVLQTISDCIRSADIKGLRAAVRELIGFDSILPGDAAQAVTNLIDDARRRAREATKAVKVLGEEDAVDAVRQILRGAPVDGLRASLVESMPAEAPVTIRESVAPVDIRIVE